MILTLDFLNFYELIIIILLDYKELFKTYKVSQIYSSLTIVNKWYTCLEPANSERKSANFGLKLWLYYWAFSFVTNTNRLLWFSGFQKGAAKIYSSNGFRVTTIFVMVTRHIFEKILIIFEKYSLFLKNINYFWKIFII